MELRSKLLLPPFFNSRFSHFLQISVAVEMEPSDVPLMLQETDILHSFLDQLGTLRPQVGPSMPVPLPVPPVQSTSPATVQMPPLYPPLPTSLPPPLVLHHGMLQAHSSPYSMLPPHQGHPSLSPAITPYHSALLGSQGHPLPSSRITGRIENLGGLNTSFANRQRLAAAATNLPRHVSLPQCTAHGPQRGPAVAPPTLTPGFSINSVLSSEGMMRIKGKVYPPQPIVMENLTYYWFHKDSFNAMLEHFSLLYSHDIPSTTLATDLVRQVIEDMKRSRMCYSFVEHYSPNILDHKALPLLLMIFRDRGRAASDSEIKL